MSLSDRLICSLILISSNRKADIAGQRLKAYGAKLLWVLFSGGTLGLLVLIIPRSFIQELPLVFTYLGFFFLVVCPLVLVWPIFATALVKADLTQVHQKQSS